MKTILKFTLLAIFILVLAYAQEQKSTVNNPISKIEVIRHRNISYALRGQSCGAEKPVVASDCWSDSNADISCCFHTMNGNNTCIWNGWYHNGITYINGLMVHCAGKFSQLSYLLIVAIIFIIF
jgi:hypothetical protein